MYATPELAPAADAVRRHDPVHGKERRELAARAERPGRAGGTGVAGERRQLAVGDDLAARDRQQRACAVGVETVRVQPQRHVAERNRVSRKKRLQTDDQRLSHV